MSKEMPERKARAVIWDRDRLKGADLIVDSLEKVTVADLERLLSSP